MPWALPDDPSIDKRTAAEWLSHAMAQQDMVATPVSCRKQIINMTLDGRQFLRQLASLMDEVEGNHLTAQGSLKEFWRETSVLTCRIQWCMTRLFIEATSRHLDL